jgi:Nucleotidyl transferase AbiEii toxin, Type IV TA system
MQLEMAELSHAQLDVAAAFFALRESEGFVVVGGAALITLELVDRLTEDLDFFVSIPGRVTAASQALCAAVELRGWSVTVLRDTESFQRLEIACDDELVRVDLAFDSAARLPIISSPIGPTLAPLELAGRKLLALFDRAQPRDFIDVYELVRRFGADRVLASAEDIDPGFQIEHLVVALRRINAFGPADLRCDDQRYEEIRRFASEWATELDARTTD